MALKTKSNSVQPCQGKMPKFGRHLSKGEAGGLCDGPAQLVPDGLGDIPEDANVI